MNPKPQVKIDRMTDTFNEAAKRHFSMIKFRFKQCVVLNTTKDDKREKPIASEFRQFVEYDLNKDLPTE
jgi:hypothetical protein